jgi:LysM repeat protein
MVADVKAANPGAESGLAVGQVITLPAKADIHHLTHYPGTKVETKPTPKPEAKTEAATHTVQAGETLYAIARKYGLKTAELRTLNGLGDVPLSIGQVLKVK